jgi:hypothetical protein
MVTDHIWLYSTKLFSYHWARTAVSVHKRYTCVEDQRFDQRNNVREGGVRKALTQANMHARSCSATPHGHPPGMHQPLPDSNPTPS